MISNQGCFWEVGEERARRKLTGSWAGGGNEKTYQTFAYFTISESCACAGLAGGTGNGEGEGEDARGGGDVSRHVIKPQPFSKFLPAPRNSRQPPSRGTELQCWASLQDCPCPAPSHRRFLITEKCIATSFPTRLRTSRLGTVPPPPPRPPPSCKESGRTWM